MNPMDETVLARFADGEMSVAEEADFLARCEIEPDRWRTVALALVEHRQVASALREFVGEPSVPSVNASTSSTATTKKRWPVLAITAASLAVLMLGGVTVAYRAGLDRGNTLAGTHGGPVEAEAASPDTEPSVVVCLQTIPSEAEPAAIQDDRSLAMSIDEIVAAKMAAMKENPVFPGEAREILLEAGVEVEEEPVLFILDDDEGERRTVPARNFHLRYVSH